MIIHSLAVTTALIMSLRYAADLHIRMKEMPRYLRKSCNLALCYVGFITNRNYYQITRAGVAAFLCCAYDVVTDWRNFQPEGVSTFDQLLEKHAYELRKMALDLLEKDRQQNLKYNGLERGITSAQFITGLIGSSKYFESITDVHRLGMALQVVDDVLDYEADMRLGDTNCLSSAQRSEYLILLAEVLPESETLRIFPHGKVLRYVIKCANEKARKLNITA